MRIFFFGSDYPPTGGGISTHTREWLSAISRDVEGKVRILGNKEPRTEKLGNLTITASRSVNFFWTAVVVKWNIFSHWNYGVFHAFNLFPVGFWVVFYCKVFRKKSVLTFYGADACDKRTSKKVLWLQKWALKNATWCITISEFTKKRVMERYGIDGHNIHVIHPVVPQLEKGEVKKETGGFTVLSVSRLVKRKGIEYLIEAISKIPDQSVKLVIVGGGPERENLENLSKKLHLEDRITFTGKVPELATYYTSADVAVLASYIIEEEGDFEGLGLVLLEAQSYGLPVIGSNSGGIPETFENGKTGLLVPERDATAIAEAILKLKNNKLQDPKVFLEKEFGKDATVGKYLKLIM